MLNRQHIFSVSEITEYLQNKFKNDPRLSNLWLRGEVSNVKCSVSGHVYFTIKDKDALLRCVCFRGYYKRLGFDLEDGMQVIARGNISIYDKGGQYQLYVQEAQPDGIGSLHIAFEQLKNKLAKEGLFDNIHKKNLPFCPNKIGVVTSKTGSVLHDIINIISRRFSGVKLYITPVSVQGMRAPSEIKEALNHLNKIQKPDVIIIARGGGSLEELWAFNTEEVARAIFGSQVPVISAVGHETDFTIADFVADLRAPTPSAAAEIVVPEIKVLEDRLKQLSLRLKNSLFFYLKESQEKLDAYSEKMKSSISNFILHKENHLKILAGTLNSLSPLKTLERGYSFTLNEKGEVLIDSKDVNKGDKVEVILARGKIFCYVDSKEEVMDG